MPGVDGYLVFQTAIDESGFNDGAKDIEQSAEKAVDGVDALASALAGAGIAAGCKEISDSLKECADSAATFENSIAKVMTIADESKVSTDGMKKSILELSGDLGANANELSESTYQAISASVDTAEAVGVVGDATKLATGGFTETATAIDILTTSMNAYGLGTDQVSRISDVLITTQNLGKTSVGELAGAMGKVIPLAAAYGMEIENLSSAYAVLTANGIKTEEAMTYIKAALNELGDSGSTVGKILTEQTGKGFSELMKEGMSLGEVLQIIGDSVGGNAAEFNNLWSSAEAGVGMLSIYNSGAEKFNGTLKQMQGSAGAADAAFEKMTDTTEYANKRFENAIENMKISVGDVLNPVLKDLYNAGTDAFEWATDFVNDHPEIVKAITVLTVTLGTMAATAVGISALKAAFDALKVTLMANPWTLLATAVAGAAAAFVSLSIMAGDAGNAIDEACEETEEFLESSEELSGSLSESRKAFKGNVKEVETTYGAYRKMADELDALAQKEEKTAADKAGIKARVDELNKAMPELNLQYDEQADALSKGADAINAYVDGMMRQAKASAIQDRMTEIYKEQLEIERNLKETEEKRKGHEADLAALEREKSKAAEKYNKDVETYGQMIADTSAATNTYEEDIAKTNEEISKLDAHEKEQVKTKEKLQDELKSLEGELGAYAEAGTESSFAQQAALDSLKEKYEEFRAQLEEDIKNKISLFDAFDGGEDMTVEEMLENLESQKEGLAEWKANMETLAGEVGTTITPEFYNAILEMGPQAANAVKHMVDTLEQGNGRELLAQMAANWGDAMDFSGPAAESLANTGAAVESKLASVLNTAKAAGVKIPKNLASGILGGTADVDETAVKLGDALSGGLSQIEQMASDAGVKIPPEIAAGLESGGTEAVSAMQSLIALINGEAEDVGTKVGESMQESQADAIKENAGDVTGSVEDSMQQAEDAANDGYDEFFGAGQNLMRGVAAGMSDRSAEVEQAARGAVQKAVKAAKDEAQIKSPSKVFKKEVGRQFVNGIVKGVEEQQEKLVRKMKSLCRDALAAAKGVVGNYSEVGTGIMDSLSAGIQEREKLAIKKSESIVEKYIDRVSTTGTAKKYDALAKKAEEKARKYEDKKGKANQKKAKKYEKQAEQYEKKADQLREIYADFGSSLVASLNEGISGAFEKLRSETDAEITEISSKYQELYDEIAGKRDDMYSKMTSPVNFYDLDTQIEEAERYRNGLDGLKGKISDTLMDEILGMGLNDAARFTEYLGSLSDAELKAYNEKWDGLVKQSKDYSEKFFAGELSGVQSEYEKKIDDALASARKKMKSVGKNICNGLIEGLNGEKETLSKECKKIADGMIKQFKKAFGIKSPSKVMEEQVGKFLPPGIVKGADKAMPDAQRRLTAGVENAIESLMDRVNAIQYVPPAPYWGVFSAPQPAAASSQPIQLQAEIHTTVDLDGRTVGRSVTPYVNRNLGSQQTREERGS